MIKTISKWGILACLLGVFAVPSFALAKLKVVTTFSILQDMTQQVAGNLAQVTSLVGPNEDVHAYSPRISDVKALAQADVVVMNGLTLEGWIERMIHASGFDGVLVVASEGAYLLESDSDHHAQSSHYDEYDDDHGDHDKHDDDHDDHDEHDDVHHDHHDDHDVHDRNDDDHHDEHDDGHDHGRFNPHAWHNIDNGKIYVRNITRGLQKADPNNVIAYRKRAAHYIRRLDSLGRSIRSGFDHVSMANRKIILPHNSLIYLTENYGISTLITAGNDASNISAVRIKRIVKESREQGYRVLFKENIGNDRVIRNLSQELGIEIAGTLYSDALSSKPHASSYLKMMRYNADLILNSIVAPSH